MKKSILMAAMACGLALAAAATDGYYWCTDDNATRKLSSTTYWLCGVRAEDGGIASFAMSPTAHTITNDLTGWTLGGLVLNGFSGTFSGNALTLTGDADVSGDGAARFLCTVQAAAGARFAKYGTGSIELAQPLTGFASVSNVYGTVVSAAAAGTLFADSDITLLGGTLKWAPAVESGANASATVGGTVLNVRGSAIVQVDKGNAASVTLTVPTIDMSERAPALRLAVTGGSAALGDTMKVKVAGTVPATVNGSADPRIVTRSTATGNALSFVAYDETDGFKPVAASGAVTDDDAAAKVVAIGADTTLPANATVGGLVVSGTPKVTGALKVGDDMHPAGVIFNDSGNNAVDFTGVTTIDFGNAPGIVWQNHKASASGIWANSGGSVKLSKITGTQGVTFGSWMNGGYCVFSMGAYMANWSGPTRIIGSAQYSHSGNAAFPAGGDVFVEGGELYTASGATYPNQHFYFAGFGGRSASYRTGGSPSAVFEGPVTLVDTTRIMHDNDGSLVFKGGVDGKGGFELTACGRLLFPVPCSFEGGIKTDAGSLCVQAENTGTLGSGPVVATGNSAKYDVCALRFYNNFNAGRAMLTHPNVFTVSGRGLEFENSVVAFTGGLKSNRTKVYDRTCVGVGAEVDLGDLQNAGKLAFVGVADESVLTFGASSDRALAFDTADGADGKRLSFVKDGAGTVTWSGTHAHTGSTTIRHGVLKLEPDVFKSPSLRYWLDASDDTTYTIGESGYVSEWRSKVGGAVFTPPEYDNNNKPYQFFGPVQTETQNGLKVLSFVKDADANVYQRLTGSLSVPNRHLFFVIRIHKDQGSNAGIFGAKGKDYGVRLSWNGGLEVNTDGQFMTRQYWINGKETNVYKPDTYVLVETFHDEDDGNASATKDVRFQPVLGGYFQWASWRNADCDIAEVLDFDTVLPDAQRVAVENYLREKWAIPGLAQQPAEPVTVLSPESELFLATAEATLDLNGQSETVKSLSGCGKIVNSSETPAVLTVTGASDFKGTIASNVRLVLPEVGTTKLETLNALPVRDGLAFWLDASYQPDEYIQTNASGEVTKWLCRAGTVSDFRETGNATRTRPHRWEPTGFPGGKPAVYFDGNKSAGYGDSLSASGACTIRTLFLVCEYVDSVGNSGFFGLAGSDVGFRCSWSPDFRTCDGLSGMGDEIFVNGTDYTGQNSAALAAAGTASIFSLRSLVDRSNLVNKTFALGQYIQWNVGQKMRFAEAIAYDRRLTDDEFAAVNDYLTAKWGTDAALPEDVEDRPYELANLTAGPGAATVEGNIVATGDWLFDFGNLQTVGSPLLTVDGSLSLGGATVGFVNHTNLTTYVDNAYLAATALEGDFSSVALDGLRFERKVTTTGQTLMRIRPGNVILIR